MVEVLVQLSVYRFTYETLKCRIWQRSSLRPQLQFQHVFMGIPGPLLELVRGYETSRQWHHLR
jgi:hypothetical protein